MGRVYKPFYTRPDGRGGRERVQVKDWYVEFQGADRKTHRERVGPDKRAATAALARAEEREARRRHGIADPADAAARQGVPLSTLRDEYLAVLEGRGSAPDYVALARGYLGRLFEGCGWQVFADLTADTLTVFLGRLRAGTAKRKGLGPATLNSFVRVAKGFGNWAADRFKVRSPFHKFAPFNEEVDRRRSTRVLADAELAGLLKAAEQTPRRYNRTFSGADRAALYRVAAYTGLRASELATLTPGHFSLDAPTPVVTVLARDAKGRREEPIPLPPHLVEFLRGWLAGRKSAARLWPGNWARHRHQAAWIVADAKRAGIVGADEPARRVTFHGLKRRYVTRLIDGGGPVHHVRRLARHKDLKTTLNYYAQSDLAGLAETAAKIPPLAG